MAVSSITSRATTPGRLPNRHALNSATSRSISTRVHPNRPTTIVDLTGAAIYIAILRSGAGQHRSGSPGRPVWTRPLVRLAAERARTAKDSANCLQLLRSAKCSALRLVQYGLEVSSDVAGVAGGLLACPPRRCPAA